MATKGCRQPSCRWTKRRRLARRITLIATKAYQLSGAVSAVAALCDSDTRMRHCRRAAFLVLPRLCGALAGSEVSAVDPGASILRTLTAEPVIGCMSFVSGEVQGDYERWTSYWPADRARSRSAR